MLTEILVIGSGGHSKVVIEAFQAVESDALLVLADEDISRVGQMLLGKLPIVLLDEWSGLPDRYHVAIGNNPIREKCSLEARQQGKRPISIVHWEACISPTAKLSEGCFVAAKAVIAAESNLEEGCIINHGAIVDHDCSIGSFSHIAPNATLGGGVIVGQGCLVGAGATILPMVKIGDHAVIGAGAVITCDVPGSRTFVGMPGRQVK